MLIWNNALHKSPGQCGGGGEGSNEGGRLWRLASWHRKEVRTLQPLEREREAPPPASPPAPWGRRGQLWAFSSPSGGWGGCWGSGWAAAGQGCCLPSGQEGLGSNIAARTLIFDLPSVSGNLWEEAGGGIHWPLQAITTVIKMAWVRLVYEKLRAEWTPERPKYI